MVGVAIKLFKPTEDVAGTVDRLVESGKGEGAWCQEGISVICNLLSVRIQIISHKFDKSKSANKKRAGLWQCDVPGGLLGLGLGLIMAQHSMISSFASGVQLEPEPELRATSYEQRAMSHEPCHEPWAASPSVPSVPSVPSDSPLPTPSRSPPILRNPILMQRRRMMCRKEIQ